jgi:phage shock protein PspC (stress-responsive transcriptional regulator)
MKNHVRNTEIASLLREPFNLNKGLMRLTIILSFVTAWLGGWFAYNNGYVIWSRYDRPVRLPFFSESVMLPLVLIAFCVAGFVAAWLAYLIAIFIIKGFRRPSRSGTNRRRHPGPDAVVEEVISVGEHKIWRSS